MAQLDTNALAAIQGTINKTQLNRMRERNRLMENIASSRAAAQQDALNLSSVIQAQQAKAQAQAEQGQQQEVQAQRQAAADAVGGGGAKGGSMLTDGNAASMTAGSDFTAQNMANQFQSAVDGSARPQTSPEARQAFMAQVGGGGGELPPSTHPRQDGGFLGTGMGFGDILRQRLNQRLGIPTPAERAMQEQQFTLNEQAIMTGQQAIELNRLNFAKGVDSHLQAVGDNFAVKPPFNRESVLTDYANTFSKAVQTDDVGERMELLNDARMILEESGDSFNRQNAELKNDLLRAQIDASRALATARSRDGEVDELEWRKLKAQTRSAEAKAQTDELEAGGVLGMAVAPSVRAGVENVANMLEPSEVSDLMADIRQAVKDGDEMPSVWTAGMARVSRGNVIPIFDPEVGRIGREVKIDKVESGLLKALNFQPPRNEDGSINSAAAVQQLDEAVSEINEQFGEEVVQVQFVLVGPDGEPIQPEIGPNGEIRDPMTDPRNNDPRNSFMIRVRSNAQEVYSDIPGQGDVVDTVLQMKIDDIEEHRGSVLRSGGQSYQLSPYNAWIAEHVPEGSHANNLPVDDEIVRNFDLFTGPEGGVSAEEAADAAITRRRSADREIAKINAELARLMTGGMRGRDAETRKRISFLKGRREELSKEASSVGDRIVDAARGIQSFFQESAASATARREGRESVVRERSGR